MQTICAFRLLAPEVNYPLHPRIAVVSRDHVIPLAINNVSAFSKRSPAAAAAIIELEQFLPTMPVGRGNGSKRVSAQDCNPSGKELGQLAGARFANAVNPYVNALVFSRTELHAKRGDCYRPPIFMSVPEQHCDFKSSVVVGKLSIKYFFRRNLMKFMPIFHVFNSMIIAISTRYCTYLAMNFA